MRPPWPPSTSACATSTASGEPRQAPPLRAQRVPRGGPPGRGHGAPRLPPPGDEAQLDYGYLGSWTRPGERCASAGCGPSSWCSPARGTVRATRRRASTLRESPGGARGRLRLLRRRARASRHRQPRHQRRSSPTSTTPASTAPIPSWPPTSAPSSTPPGSEPPGQTPHRAHGPLHPASAPGRVASNPKVLRRRQEAGALVWWPRGGRRALPTGGLDGASPLALFEAVEAGRSSEPGRPTPSSWRRPGRPPRSARTVTSKVGTAPTGALAAHRPHASTPGRASRTRRGLRRAASVVKTHSR